MNIVNVNNILVEYINKNKERFNIDYNNSIETLRELLDEIEKEYEFLDKNKYGDE